MIFSGCQTQNHLIKAESFYEAGKYEDAIREYERHISMRQEEKRQEWENPDFYQIRIASLYLKLDKVDEALKTIKIAEQKKVEKDLILDGIREIAEYLAAHDKIDAAIDLLDSYKSYDETYVDGLVDKIGKSALKESN